MKIIFKINVLFATLLLTACMQAGVINSSNNAPQWLHGEPDLYPNFKYLSATGSAADAEQAKARALSNLAKIFEVQIREVSTSRSDVHSSKTEEVESVQQSHRIASMVNLKTDKMIQGARIAEQWQSAADLSHHALAVLDRAQAGNNIRTEITRLDEETQFVLTEQQKRTDDLLKIADLHTASGLQQDRYALQKTLKIIDLNGNGVTARWSQAELDERLQQALRSLPVTTAIKADDIGGLHAILQAAAAEAGFNVSVPGYQLTVSLDAQQPVNNSGWYWLKATLVLELIAQDGQTVIGQRSWSLKVSAASASQLASRMRSEVDKKLKQELLSSLLGFAG